MRKLINVGRIDKQGYKNNNLVYSRKGASPVIEANNTKTYTIRKYQRIYENKENYHNWNSK